MIQFQIMKIVENSAIIFFEVTKCWSYSTHASTVSDNSNELAEISITNYK